MTIKMFELVFALGCLSSVSALAIFIYLKRIGTVAVLVALMVFGAMTAVSIGLMYAMGWLP